MIGFRVSREEQNTLYRDYIRIIPLFHSRMSLPRRRTPNMQNQNPCIATKIQNAFMHGNSFLQCASVSSSVPSLWRSSQILRCCLLPSKVKHLSSPPIRVPAPRRTAQGVKEAFCQHLLRSTTKIENLECFGMHG